LLSLGNLQIRAPSVITRAPAARLIKGCRGGGEVLKSMIPKSGYRFSEKIMLKMQIERAPRKRSFVDRGRRLLPAPLSGEPNAQDEDQIGR
jgi:hypothetical protein